MNKTMIGLAIAVAATAVATTVTTTANAASTSCGNECLALTAQAYGDGTAISVPQRGQAWAGEQVLTRPAGPSILEDFEFHYLGSALSAYGRGEVTAAIAHAWPEDPVSDVGLRLRPDPLCDPRAASPPLRDFGGEEQGD